MRTPEQCPSVVSLLAESYNPHVRYGAAMALGIACAGSGLKDATALLSPMTTDQVNFVRQGALIASAMVLIQQTERTCPKMNDFRTLYAKIIQDKQEDVMAKFGAILAQGIIDAGGRNVTVSLQSRTGHANMLALVGVLLFTQYWYWYPLALWLALAFTPTCVIALNAQLKMPKLEFRSNAQPSVFGYPPPLDEKKHEEREKVTAAILSIVARARRRETSRLEVGQVQVDSSKTVTNEDIDEGKEKKIESKENDLVVKNKKTETKSYKKKAIDTQKQEMEATSEPDFEILNNPARVMKEQLKVLQQADGGRYIPLKDLKTGGIIMVRQKQSRPFEELVEPVTAFGLKQEEEKEESPPEPFEYTEV